MTDCPQLAHPDRVSLPAQEDPSMLRPASSTPLMATNPQATPAPDCFIQLSPRELSPTQVKVPELAEGPCRHATPPPEGDVSEVPRSTLQDSGMTSQLGATPKSNEEDFSPLSYHFPPGMDYDKYSTMMTPILQEAKSAPKPQAATTPGVARQLFARSTPEKGNAPLPPEETPRPPDLPFTDVSEEDFATTVTPVKRVTKGFRPRSSSLPGDIRQAFSQGPRTSTPVHTPVHPSLPVRERVVQFVDRTVGILGFNGPAPSPGCPPETAAQPEQAAVVSPSDVDPATPPRGPSGPSPASGRPPDTPIQSQQATATYSDPVTPTPGACGLSPASGRPPDVSAQFQQGKTVPSLDPDAPHPGPSGQAPASGRPPESPGSCSTSLPGPSGQAPASGRPPESPGGCSTPRPGDTPPPPVLTPAGEGVPPGLNSSKGARPPPLLSPMEPQSPRRTVLADPPQTGAVPIEGSSPLSTSTPERNAPHPQRPPGPLHVNGEDPAPLSDSDTTLVYPQGDQGDQGEPEGEEEVTVCCTLYDKGDGDARGPGPPRVPTGRDGLH